MPSAPLPSAALHDMPALRRLADRYAALVAAGEIEADPAQRAVVARLDALAEALAETAPATKHSPLGWLFSRGKPKPEPVRGLYIYGDVGRGKTMLMDLFFELAPVARKRRVHFHEFMAETQERIHEARQAIVAGTLAGDDPIAPVAEAIASETRLLCFDEFSVTDIADAMILGRLFTRLFADGVVMVATSNVAPDDLYAGGLNRALFLPFIALLKRHVDVARLEARTDFRLEKLHGGAVYLTPLGPEADAAMDAAWRRLTGGAKPKRLGIENKGRAIDVPCAAQGTARFGFSDLCEKPLGASDYLKIAHAFHTLLIDRIPVLGPEKRNEAKRLINLIDALYDNRVKLVASAAAPPDRLYRGSEGAEVFEFRRTASRLVEMQSEDYLALPHGPSGRAPDSLDSRIEG